MIDNLSWLQDLCYELRWTYKALIILISTLDVDLFWHRRHEKCRALCGLADLRTCGLADLQTCGLADLRTFADTCRACMSRCQHKTAPDKPLSSYVSLDAIRIQHRLASQNADSQGSAARRAPAAQRSDRRPAAFLSKPVLPVCGVCFSRMRTVDDRDDIATLCCNAQIAFNQMSLSIKSA